MGIFSHMQAKKEARKRLEEAHLARVEQAKKEKLQFEKGDKLALLIAAFFNFILPIMLVLGLICLITYYFFTRF
ncbi:MAG: hypothetical protein IJ214_13235 [Clostridia bacterium]|nr:hypothetical protein [Clostridia bacterium]